MNRPEDQSSNPYRPLLSDTLPPVKKMRSRERTENHLQFGFVLVASQTFGMLIGDGLQRFYQYLPDIPPPFVCGLFACVSHSRMRPPNHAPIASISSALLDC